MPSGRVFYLLALVSTLVVTGVLVPGATWAAVFGDFAIIAALIVDWWRARRSIVTAQRRWPSMLFQDLETTAEVVLRNRGNSAVTVMLRETLDPALSDSAARQRFDIGAGEERIWEISIRPRKRGEHRIGPLFLRALGPWKLAWAQQQLLGSEVERVYPQVRWDGRVGHLLLLAHHRALGQNPKRLHGIGSEPYALREYRSGDAPNMIQWRASARHGRLISREDTWERGAHLVVLLDCGRSMAARLSNDCGAGHKSKLDCALAASLALSRVAASRGDRVSLVAFSDRIESAVGIHGTGKSMAEAYKRLYDLNARLVEPSFDLAVEKAIELESRRSIVMVLTSIADLAASRLLRRSLVRLERRHTAMLVNLLDPELLAMTKESSTTALDVFAKVAALDIVLANRALATRLHHAGVRVVSASADRLALETIETFLAVQGGRQSHSGASTRRRSA